MDEPASYEWSTGPVCGIDNCPATRYIRNADGTKSCENGHINNEVIYDQDDYADPGARTTRKKKEKAERRKLPVGVEQRRLLVNSLQWVLRKQIWWLIHEKGFPPEFEVNQQEILPALLTPQVLVQELWLVRRMELSQYIDQDWDPESLTEEIAFSQIGDSEDEGASPATRNVLATLPTLTQGLALLYLSSCILNLPVFMGDFLDWANYGDLPYRDIHNLLPRDMWDRLLVTSKLLMPSRRQLLAVHLLKASRLVYRAYRDRLGLIMPPLNVPLCLYRMVERLALPFDVYPVARRLAHMLRINFEFPASFPPRWQKRMPDVQLACMLVVAVKLLYPFDQRARHPRWTTEPTVTVVDWNVWLREREKLDGERSRHLPLTDDEAENLREVDVPEMSGEMLDRYMDWFQQRWIISAESQRPYQRSNLRANMNALFPLDGAPTSLPDVQAAQDNPDDNEEPELDESSPASPSVEQPQEPTPTPSKQIPEDRRADASRLHLRMSERLDKIQRTLLVRDVVEESSAQDADVERPGSEYRRIRLPEDLEGPAKAFHAAVAELVGLPLPELLEAVLHYEWAVEKQWTQPQKRRLKRRKDRLYDEE
jgi:RNA polymerase I-specific transcription initiation factor RRN7